MLAIRMQRNGRVHTPVYRIVVQEAQRHPLSGRVVAEVGNYNPETKKTVLDQEKDRVLSRSRRPALVPGGLHPETERHQIARLVPGTPRPPRPG